jgi:hypothetical protein
MSTLEKITRGDGEPGDLEMMRRAADTMVKTALCGLGQAASNPVTSSLRYFLSEYEQHINCKNLPASVCPDLLCSRFAERCSGCGLCAWAYAGWMPSGQAESETHQLDASLCINAEPVLERLRRQAIVGVPMATRLNEYRSQRGGVMSQPPSDPIRRSAVEVEKGSPFYRPLARTKSTFPPCAISPVCQRTAAAACAWSKYRAGRIPHSLHHAG